MVTSLHRFLFRARSRHSGHAAYRPRPHRAGIPANPLKSCWPGCFRRFASPNRRRLHAISEWRTGSPDVRHRCAHEAGSASDRKETPWARGRLRPPSHRTHIAVNSPGFDGCQTCFIAMLEWRGRRNGPSTGCALRPSDLVAIGRLWHPLLLLKDKWSKEGRHDVVRFTGAVLDLRVSRFGHCTAVQHPQQK